MNEDSNIRYRYKIKLERDHATIECKHGYRLTTTNKKDVSGLIKELFDICMECALEEAFINSVKPDSFP